MGVVLMVRILIGQMPHQMSAHGSIECTNKLGHRKHGRCSYKNMHQARPCCTRLTRAD